MDAMAYGKGMWGPLWLTIMFASSDALEVEGTCFLYISTICFTTSRPSSLSSMRLIFYIVGMVVAEMFSRLTWCWRCVNSSWMFTILSCNIESFYVSTCMLLECEELLKVFSMPNVLLSILGLVAWYNPRSTTNVLSWYAMICELLTKVLSI